VAECDPHGLSQLLSQLPLPPSLPRATVRDHTFGIQRRYEVCAGVEVEWREATLNQNGYGTVLGDLRNPLIPTKTRSNHVQGCSFASLTCHLRGNGLCICVSLSC
jgi:hypothetical protein